MNEFDEARGAASRSIAARTNFSADAVETMARAVAAGQGRMAQFDHPEFGGAGQWMAGGMLMIADWSDDALRARVGQLCEALAALPSSGVASASSSASSSAGGSHQSQSQLSGGLSPAAASPADAASGRWWPSSLGMPDTSGGQDGMRYAWFSGAQRLVIDDGGGITAYDTGDHRIGGVSQQQGGHRTLSFTSQHGAVDVAGLPVARAEVSSPDHEILRADSRKDGQQPAYRSDRATADDPPAPAGQASRTSPDGVAIGDPFHALERLADLHARGVVDAAEFAAKKAELLARI